MVRIYGPVRNAEDITKINKRIRADVRRATTRPALVELAKRSMYLWTLANSPAWRRAFPRSKLLSIKRRAKKEYHITAKMINKKISGRKLDTIIGPGR